MKILTPRIPKLICLSLLMLVIIGCSSAESAYHKQFDLGVKYVSEGNYEEAIIALTEAIQINPKQIDAYINRAKTYLKLEPTQENYALAEKDYLTAIEIDESNRDAYSGLGSLYFALYHDEDAALEILERGIRNTGDSGLQNAYDYILNQKNTMSSVMSLVVNSVLNEDWFSAANACKSVSSETFYGCPYNRYPRYEGEKDENGSPDGLGIGMICFHNHPGEPVSDTIHEWGFYYGNWSHGIPDGHGAFVSSDTILVGDWNNSVPNGSFTKYRLSTNDTVVLRMRFRMTGNAVNGQWQGLVRAYDYDYDIEKDLPLSEESGGITIKESTREMSGFVHKYILYAPPDTINPFTGL